MGGVFIDTGAWTALFAENDGRHSEAVVIFDNLERDKAILYTSDYVVDEALTLIQARGRHGLAVTAGKAIFGSAVVKMVPVTPEYFESTWTLFQKYSDKKFSFTDISTLVIMNALNIKKLFSFDGEFKKVGIELLS